MKIDPIMSNAILLEINRLGRESAKKTGEERLDVNREMLDLINILRKSKLSDIPDEIMKRLLLMKGISAIDKAVLSSKMLQIDKNRNAFYSRVMANETELNKKGMLFVNGAISNYVINKVNSHVGKIDLDIVKDVGSNVCHIINNMVKTDASLISAISAYETKIIECKKKIASAKALRLTETDANVIRKLDIEISNKSKEISENQDLISIERENYVLDRICDVKKRTPFSDQKIRYGLFEDPDCDTAKYASDVLKNMPEDIVSAISKFVKTNGGLIKCLNINSRSYVSYKNGCVSMYIRSRKVSLHEVCHLIELAIPSVVAMEHDFFNQRTNGFGVDRMIRSSSLLYKTDEIFKEDKFLHPYYGKVYKNGDSYEILSMGFDELCKNPSVMIASDKETAGFVAGLMLLSR